VARIARRTNKVQGKAYQLSTQVTMSYYRNTAVTACEIVNSFVQDLFFGVEQHPKSRSPVPTLVLGLPVGTGKTSVILPHSVNEIHSMGPDDRLAVFVKRFQDQDEVERYVKSEFRSKGARWKDVVRVVTIQSAQWPQGIRPDWLIVDDFHLFDQKVLTAWFQVPRPLVRKGIILLGTPF
jgi:hypothetical protein